MASTQRIAVIGAGAAGLCAAKHLLLAGHDVTIFELGSHIGGLWVYENDNGRSPAYRSLHINSEAKVTGYRDFPLPKEAGLFPSHTAVREYLEAYADTHDLRRRIRFHSRVASVEPTGAPSPAWRVELADGTSDDFDAVVVANGHQAEPMHPPFAEDFTGDYLHSLQYRVPEAFAGKDVLVVGVGNSGLDIAADVCTATRSTVVAARSPVLVMPRMLLGAPLSRFLAKVERPWLPWPVRRRVRELVTQLVHGRMEDWGFVTPKVQTHPSSHPTLFSHMSWGRIHVRPGVTEVVGREVHFSDGSAQTFDAIIAATGYEIDLPFLAPELSPVAGHRIDLYRRVVHADHPGLYFAGLFDVSGGANIRMMDIQSRWLAAVVNGDVVLPDAATMRASFREEQRRMQRHYPDRPRYGLELDPREYGLSLRADMQEAAERKRLEEAERSATDAAVGEDFRAPVG